nr:MAG TPA: hypothetical protein [Caudoviricetes sp.]
MVVNTSFITWAECVSLEVPVSGFLTLYICVIGRHKKPFKKTYIGF